MPTTNFTKTRANARQRNRISVRLPDRFDVHQVESFDRRMADALPAGGEPCLVDCSSVRFVDQTAIQALIDARLSLLDRGTDLHLVNLSVAMRVTLDLTGQSLLVLAPDHAEVSQ